MRRARVCIALPLALTLASTVALVFALTTRGLLASEVPDARAFMAAIIDESRGQSSYAELTMTITPSRLDPHVETGLMDQGTG